MPLIYLALGSNLGDRHHNLDKAISLIEKRIGHIIDISKRYETEPEGFVSSSLFVNVVLAADTALSPMVLLQATQEIERDLGRSTKSIGNIYQDRPIDIDILLYSDYRYDSPELTIPHRHMCNRFFVLEPLVEIAPSLIHPCIGKSMYSLLESLSQSYPHE